MPILTPLAAASLKAWGFLASAGISPVASDPYFNYTTLLLHGDGTNGAQNNTFLDSSTNNFTITRNGNTTQGTFSPFSQTGWSNYFDTSAYLSVASDLVGSTTSTFTVDGWVYLTATPTSSFEISAFCGLSGQGNGANNYMSFGPTSDSKITLRWFDGATKSAKSTTTLALNTWYYIACVVNSNAISMFINGVSETVTGTTTLTNRGGTATESYIGGKAHTYATLAGYISNIRVSSVARTITAQTAPFTSDANTTILTCNSNRFVDTSSSPKTLTIGGSPSVQAFSPFAPTAAYSAATVGGSGYFDGSGDYLSLASNANLTPASGNFCVECWIYPIAFDTYNGIFVGNDVGGFFFGKLTGGIGLRISATSDVISATAPSTNQWTHVAITRSGTDVRLFYNGVQQGSTVTNSTNFVQSATYIGTDGSGGSYWNGYISGLRFVKGSSVYTSNFTPSTTPLTAITNTQLLLNFTNGGIIDNTAKNVLETVGNAQISTSVKKFGTGSFYTGATSGSHYLRLPAHPFYQFGTESFTIEGWFQPLLGGNERTFYAHGLNTTGGMALFVGTGGVRFRAMGQNDLSYATTISDSTFTHIAFVRDGNTRRIFINGTQVASDTLSFNVSDNVITDIGASAQNASDSFKYYGYIDDLRITKGIARYTTTFTPPTAAFPDL